VTLSAEELHRRGVEHGNAGRNAAARRALVTAAARAVDADLQTRIAGTLAYLAARTGDPESAESLCRAALNVEGVSTEAAAVLEGQLGLIALHRGDLSTAVDWLTRGIDGIGSSLKERARMFLNRSVAHMGLGRLGQARADLDAAIRDFEEANRPQDAAMAEHNLGYILLLEGDIVSALARMIEARRVLAADSAVNAAICDLDRAEVLRDAGLVTEAELLLESVARVFGAHRMRQARGETELNLARSLLRHDPAHAAKVAGAAARRFEALGSGMWAARAEGIRVRALLAGGTMDRAGRVVADPRRIPPTVEVERVAQQLDEHGARGEATSVRLAGDLWGARHGVVAPARATRLPRAAPLEVRLLAHEARAARAASAGRLAEARRHAVRGLDELSDWQRSFGSLDLQTSLAMHGSGLVFAGIAAAMRSRRPEVVFEWSERARHLSQQIVPLRPPPDERLAADLAELRLLRVDLPADRWLGDPRAAELSERVRERQWANTGAGAVEASIDLEGLRATLDDDVALLSFIFGPEGLVCLVVDRDRAVVVDLPEWATARAALPGLRADLDMSATVRLGPIADAVRRSLDDRLAALSSTLLQRPAAVAGARRLVLTVPGVLNGIPWAMLPDMRGRVFTLATSATRWAVLNDRAPTPHARAGFAAGPRVARGDEEVQIAASAWADATVRQGADASVGAVTALASEADVLHVAAHGRHAVDNPLFSGLELADGTLFGYDIDLIPRVPDTVVLSACEVGRSSVRWGEEAIGMTRIWLHAGTRCVIAAPVVVADDVACELLGAMHEGLAAGEAPAEALAAASERTGIVAPFQAHGSGF